jgi:hypothetical protein
MGRTGGQRVDVSGYRRGDTVKERLERKGGSLQVQAKTYDSARGTSKRPGSRSKHLVSTRWQKRVGKKVLEEMRFIVLAFHFPVT